MPKCSYCGEKMEPGTGTLFVKANGKTMWFCKKKCEKNFGLGRDSKNMRWIKSA
jgi:large subunit ribosomal protein L24e